ncbi:MAG: hypothetical protein C4563_06265, partial [Desulfobulbus sp.]
AEQRSVEDDFTRKTPPRIFLADRSRSVILKEAQQNIFRSFLKRYLLEKEKKIVLFFLVIQRYTTWKRAIQITRNPFIIRDKPHASRHQAPGL